MGLLPDLHYRPPATLSCSECFERALLPCPRPHPISRTEPATSDLFLRERFSREFYTRKFPPRRPPDPCRTQHQILLQTRLGALVRWQYAISQTLVPHGPLLACREQWNSVRRGGQNQSAASDFQAFAMHVQS